ncbi:MAG: MATE family efflux transporter [Elusimicrobia bacterium]|nr:MATE family efflux transporter [Elusimicrobiota bacterium]
MASKSSNKHLLTQGNIPTQLLYLAFPTIIGMLGMVVFNLTDTFFLGRLGPNQLTALSFTFPVIMVVQSFAHGIGMGSSVLTARAFGAQNNRLLKRITTDSLVLGFIITLITSSIGLLTIEPLFTALGAEGEILSYIKDYMSIWYLGVIMVVIPMIGNHTIRAIGDTKTPGLIMALSASINIILDPLLIFGIGPFPRLEVKGAAIATVFARSITALVAIYVLRKREGLISFKNTRIKEIIDSWKQIIYIGLPNSLTRMAPPLVQGVIVRLLAGFGPYAVAGFGIGTRIEIFALSPIMALSSVFGPFMGQNLGAKKYGRMKSADQISKQYSFIAGFSSAAILFLAAPTVAKIFSKNTEIINSAVLYMRIVPISYGLWGIFQLGTVFLNVMKKPFIAAGWTMTQFFILVLPFAFLGAHLAGEKGILIALSISYILSGLLIRQYVKNLIPQPTFSDKAE